MLTISYKIVELADMIDYVSQNPGHVRLDADRQALVIQ